jgi:predicted RNA-binding Zn ribbon-like protein
MMDALFAQPRKKIGQSEALLAKSMRAWAQEGHLQGDEFAVARGILRDGARAVDSARSAMSDGLASAYSFARTVRVYQELVTMYRSGEEVQTDDLDDLLRNLASAGPVRDPQE